MARTKKTIDAATAALSKTTLQDSGSERVAPSGEEESDDNKSILPDKDDEEEEEEDEDEEEEDEDSNVNFIGPQVKPPYQPRSEEVDDMQILFRRLGFPTETSRHLTDFESIASPKILWQLDDPQVEQIVKNARKSNGSDGKPLIAPNLAMVNFQTAVLVAKHFARTSRVLTTKDIDLDHFPAYRAQRDVEEKDSKIKVDLPTGLVLDNTPNAARVFDSVLEHLGRHRGINGAPLSYVVREQIYPPTDQDPIYLFTPFSRYASFDEEMVRRSPIVLTPQTPEQGPFHPSFLADMRQVWNILHDLFSTQTVWTHVKNAPSARNQNGRLCFRELHRYILGDNNVHQLGQVLLDKLNATKYDGPTKNWTFTKYVTAHVNLHNQAFHLEKYGYQGMTGYAKVNAFTRNISERAGFGAVAMSVFADASLADDFEKVKNLYVDFHRRHLLAASGSGNTASARSVSAVKTGTGDKKRKSTSEFRGKVPTQVQLDNCKVQNRAYSSDEYKALDWIARYKLHVMRKDSGGNSGKRARGASSTVSSLTQTDAGDDAAGGTDATVVTGASGGSGSNSTNPALVRPNPADRR